MVGITVARELATGPKTDAPVPFIDFRNETFHIESSATNATLKVYDRKTIGKDKEIGEAQLEVCFSVLCASKRVERVRI